MAIAEHMTVKGAKELEAALKGLGKVPAGKAIRGALRDSMDLIRDEQANRANVLTGKMKGALTVRAGKRSRKGFSFRSIFGPKGKAAKLRKESKSGKVTFYPAVVEYGDKDTPANPFLRPAFEAKKGEALDLFAGRLRTLVKEQWAKAK